MECTRHVKESILDIDKGVIFTDDLPVKWCSKGLSGEAEKFDLQFTFLKADAGVDLHSVSTRVNVQGYYYYGNYDWYPIEDGNRVVKWSETEKEDTLSFSTKPSAKLALYSQLIFQKKVKIIFTMIIHKLRSIPLSGYNFTEENEARDQILVVGDKKFYINKAVLSHYSPYFNSLFNNKNFKESKQAEIELKDLVSKEFEVLLQVLHPSDVTVNADNVEFLWNLADRFGVTCVAEMCEEFISNIEGKGTGAFSFANRMKMAQLYNSEKLMVSLLKQMEKL